MSILCIGGVDSGGAAGLLRDCETVRAFGQTGKVAVTAVTAQTNAQVAAVQPVDPKVVAAQIAAADGVKAVKIGMLHSAPIVTAVAEALPLGPVVLDPVIAASSGGRLLDDAGLSVLLADLVPKVTVMTPNLPELAVIEQVLGQDPIAALLSRGCQAVLVKGGHAEGEAVDILHRMDAAPKAFAAPRLAGAPRGTGCAMASALACGLAAGQSLPAAVEAAKAHVRTLFTTA